MEQPCNGYKLHPMYTAASYHNTHAVTSAARSSELSPGYRQTLVLTTKRGKKICLGGENPKRKCSARWVRSTIRATHQEELQ